MIAVMAPASPVPETLEEWLKIHPNLPGLLFAALCLLVLLVLVLPRLASRRRSKGRPVLDPVQLNELLLGSGALVVDLRGEEAYRAGHIRGSLHVPYESLLQRFERPDPTARRPLVLVDETDELSHQAFALLVSRGFEWLYVLQGGMRGWRRTNRPLSHP